MAGNDPITNAMRLAKGGVSEEERQRRIQEQGYTGPWYHGAGRSDRLVSSGAIDPRRATSGPMPFFTDDPAIASNYAHGKEDTSLSATDEGNVQDYFTVHPKALGWSGRTPIPVERTWHFLSPEVKKDILSRAKRVGYENLEEQTGPFKLHPEGTDASPSSDHFDYIMRTEARGNPLHALREIWHDSGNLVGNERDLADIYQLAGYPHPISQERAPWTEASGVMPAYLRMRKPLDTSNLEELKTKVIPHLEKVFARDRSRKQQYGADMWDKNTRYTPKEWLAQLKEDAEKGENSFAFTSIPDKVTEALRQLGYDGILDTGGKMGGEGHTVAVPFEPHQVRGRFAQFDPAKQHEKGFMKASGGVVDQALDLTRNLNPQGLYSHGAEAARQLPQASGTMQQLGAMLQKCGVKPAEMQNTGFDWNSPTVAQTKNVAKAFEQKLPQVHETELSREPLERLQRRVSNAREMRANLPEDASREQIARARQEFQQAADAYSAYAAAGQEKGYDLPKYEQYALPGGFNYRELLLHAPLKITEGDAYKSSHWNTSNVLAHLRMSDRRDPTDPEGGKMLHLDELQSDWGQDARKHGIKDPKDAARMDAFAKRSADIMRRKLMGETITPEEEKEAYEANKLVERYEQGIPHHPYIANTNAWVDLGLKRALLEAAKNDHTRLVWTPGYEHADRYGLQKKFSQIRFMRGKNGEDGVLDAYGPDGRIALSRNVKQHELPEYVGRELAERLLSTPSQDVAGGEAVQHSLTGDNLRTGGEGMKAFYDKLVPQRLAEIVKKLGHKAEFEPVRITHGKKPYHTPNTPVNPEDLRTTLHSLKLTPELKEAIRKGMPAFKRGGDVLARASGGHVTLRAAGVMLHDPEDRVLFVKRAHKAGDHGGKWAFPGGKIEHGESAHEAAARETHEEIGHRIGTKLGAPVDHRMSKDGVEFTTFKHRVPKQFEPKLNEEHTEHRWAHPNAAPEPLHPGVKATLDKLAKGGDVLNHASGGRATLRPPKKLYRGIVEGQQESGAQGLGTAHLGRGLYSSPSKSFAKMYATHGRVDEVPVEHGWPKNPLVLRGAGGAESLLLDHVFRNTNFKNAREFNAAYPDRAKFLREHGYDGVVAGDEVVRFPEEGKGRVEYSHGGDVLNHALRLTARPAKTYAMGGHAQE